MKKQLRHTAALTALLAGAGLALTGTAHAQTEKGGGNEIRPHHGDLDPFGGDINPFYGDINPFYGDISPFWGDISPFWGDINPFWGDISPFWGDIDPFHGDINPFWGDINPFWEEAGPLWGDINEMWSQLGAYDNSTRGDYRSLARELRRLLDRASDVFDPMAEHEGARSVNEAFLNELLERYGINPDDPASLEAVDARARSRFFLEFYDGLMQFSGTDRVDHWMATANWSPALSQAAGMGDGAKVGVIDFGFAEGFTFDDLGGTEVRIRSEGGPGDFYHGAAVVSLLASAHNGDGMMGIAPDAHYSLYNPFDETYTSNWGRVRDAVDRLTRGNTHVINLSLGVPGWTLHSSWEGIFSDRHISRNGNRTLFVIAAGNDGLEQTRDVDWARGDLIDNMILVGSVGPTGEISSFSNRPGTACINIRNRCSEGNRLMDRFLVAPGELLLVSDGEGGYLRASGTSFAAPIVSGAAALIFGHWKWLGGEDVADILLESATDLGAPGTDPVYGRGMLNIAAAMAPLNPDNLYQLREDGSRVYVGDMGLNPGALSFETPTANLITVFEDTQDSYRDFQVEVDSVNPDGSSNMYLGERIYLTGTVSTVDPGTETTSDEEPTTSEPTPCKKRKKNDSCFAFSDAGELSWSLSGNGVTHVALTASRRDPHNPLFDGQLPFQLGLEMTNRDTGTAVRLGFGEGGMAMSSQTGFGLFSDHRPETGGVNPVLGFASGGAYAMAGLQLSDRTSLSFGASETRESLYFVNPLTGEEQPAFGGLDTYEAQALNIELRHLAGDHLSFNASYTMLTEDTGLLGAHGSGQLSFDGGSVTDAVTFGAEADLGPVFLSSSATLARTRSTAFDNQILSLSDDIYSSSYQVSALRNGFLGDNDLLRVSLIQPLHIEDGRIDYTASQVIDRETGERAIVTEQWELGGLRPTFVEVLWASPVHDGRGELSVFGRFEASGEALTDERVGVTSGARYALRF